MLKKICAWGSGILVVLGLVAGGIGVLMGGLDTVKILFWM